MIGCLCCVTSNSYLGDLPRSIYTELGTYFTWCVCAYNCVPCRVSICSRLVSCSCSIPGWPCLWPWHWRDLETYLSRAPSDPPWHCHVVQYRFVTSHASIFIFVFYMQLTLSHSFYYPISFMILLILCFAWLLYLTHWCLNKLIFSRYFRMQFHERKFWYLIQISNFVLSISSNCLQVSIDSGNGLASSWWQAITWTSGDPNLTRPQWVEICCMADYYYLYELKKKQTEHVSWKLHDWFHFFSVL